MCQYLLTTETVRINLQYRYIFKIVKIEDPEQKKVKTKAVIMTGPGNLEIADLELKKPKKGDVVVEIDYSGVSTGTEKLFWSGEMPAFPGMGYPLVPGYESTGEVVEVGPESGLNIGDIVFAPGANCFGNVKSLFGGAARYLVTPADRLIKIDQTMGPSGALFALAATARHALAGFDSKLPDLIVGNGVLGRLLARLTVAAGGEAPTIWENNKARIQSTHECQVIDPQDDEKTNYSAIYDASGDAKILDSLVGRVKKGGEIVLAGFYPGSVSFMFAPAFIKEARFRIAAEFTTDDVIATRSLIESNALSLEGLISDIAPVSQALSAYEKAFNKLDCLKMVLDWRNAA